MPSFPKDFIWGAATASYQIEGGWDADGKGPSIWDTMTHDHPEKVLTRENGDVACDSYHKLDSDLKIIKELGINCYRFSISWPRILPNGSKDIVNKAGIAYYNKLIDGLLAIGVQPAITMFHWDLPQALEDEGGWLNANTVKHFTDYANVLYENFGDRVKMWITLNEPRVVCFNGYESGTHAPNAVGRDADMYLAGHHMILAHASAYRLYNDKYKATQNGQVGITLNSKWSIPKSDSDPAHVAAAERAMMFGLGWFAQPIFKDGGYPSVMVTSVGKASKEEGCEKSKLPEFTEEEKKIVSHSADFLGLNYYSSHICSPGTNETARGFLKHRDISAEVGVDWVRSTLPWLNSYPQGLGQVLKYIDVHFDKIPVYVTENGTTDMSGTLEDVHRIEYYKQHLEQVLNAMDVENCNVKGYFAWSLMDNFEWAEGYSQKFGLHFVDFNDPDRPRVPKASAKFYANVIKNGKL